MQTSRVTSTASATGERLSDPAKRMTSMGIRILAVLAIVGIGYGIVVAESKLAIGGQIMQAASG